jgi:hypothetical protein
MTTVALFASAIPASQTAHTDLIGSPLSAEPSPTRLELSGMLGVEGSSLTSTVFASSVRPNRCGKGRFQPSRVVETSILIHAESPSRKVILSAALPISISGLSCLHQSRVASGLSVIPPECRCTAMRGSPNRELHTKIAGPKSKPWTHRSVCNCPECSPNETTSTSR